MKDNLASLLSVKKLERQRGKVGPVVSNVARLPGVRRAEHSLSDQLATPGLGDGDLPHHNDPAWVKRRKIRVVAAVRTGTIPLHLALKRFNLTTAEYLEWEQEVGKDVAKRRKDLGRIVRGQPIFVSSKRRK